jgi:hypothetical protein
LIERIKTWWSKVPESSPAKRLYYWYWAWYYEYGRLYCFWLWLFPVTGREATMYSGPERRFRPVYLILRRWHRLRLRQSVYLLARKYKNLSRANALRYALEYQI